MPSPLADITRFLGGYRQGQLEAEDRDYTRQQRAFEEEDRAAIMRETGYSPSVLKAQQIKMQMDRLREEAETSRIANISGKAGRLLAMGDTAGANQTLRSGGLDAVQIDDDPEDPEYVHFTTKVGKYRVPRITGSMIAQNPLEYARNEMSLDRMLAQQEARQQASMQLQEQKQKATAAEKQADRDLRWRIAQLSGRAAGAKAGVKSAVLQVVDSLANTYVQSEGMDPVAAKARAFREYALKQTDMKERQLALQGYKVYFDAVKDFLSEKDLKREADLARQSTTPKDIKQEAPSGIPRIKNASEYGALKSGTVFIDPNGVKRRKP